mmetsp:Transcript_39022/g.64306  ORF Transcript_39022/g.64306 Transcript_39022/m.64306 type:complete len:161 (+) Transcript_39022:744-1226(+)
MIQVEVNPEVPYPVSFGVNYDKGFKPQLGFAGFYGCSLTLTSSLVRQFGYQLVGIGPFHDAFYVRDDYMAGLEPLTDEVASNELGECCIPGHFGHKGSYKGWKKMMDESGAEAMLESVRNVVRGSCSLSQGTGSDCNIPFTVSLRPADFVAQLEGILHEG